VAERNSAADNVYPRSVTERSGWFRNWLELRARGYEEAMRIASEDMDTRENVDNLTPMDIWLLDWKLASERGKSAQTTSVDPEAWAQNYQCYLSRAKAVVQQMQNRIIIQNAMHYRELEQEIAKCKAVSSDAGKDLESLQKDLDASSRSLRTWKRIWGGMLRKQTNRDEEMVDVSEQKARSTVRSLDAVVVQQSQLLSTRKATKKASELRCGMIEWRQGIRARAAFQESEMLSRAYHQLSDLEEEVSAASHALTRLGADAPSLQCSSDDVEDGDGIADLTINNTEIDQHRFFLQSSLKFMHSSLHLASDLGYTRLEAAARSCKRLHSQVDRAWSKLIVVDDDLVSVEKRVDRKKKVLDRLRLQIEALKQAESEAKTKSFALSETMGTAGLDETQVKQCQEAIAQMQNQEKEARQQVTARSSELEVPEAEYQELLAQKREIQELAAALREDVGAVRRMADECDASVAGARKGTQLLAKHSSALGVLVSSFQGEQSSSDAAAAFSRELPTLLPSML